MGFKPMAILQNIFYAYNISTKKAFKNQTFMGFKPMTKYSSAFEILKTGANGM